MDQRSGTSVIKRNPSVPPLISSDCKRSHLDPPTSVLFRCCAIESSRLYLTLDRLCQEAPSAVIPKFIRFCARCHRTALPAPWAWVRVAEERIQATEASVFVLDPNGESSRATYVKHHSSARGELWAELELIGSRRSSKQGQGVSLWYSSASSGSA
jgi:hypothetical protein